MSQTPTTPAEAFAALMEGNARFVAGRSDHPRQDSQRRTEVAVGQDPFAVVFGCSDSRVPTEIIFDQGFGDLFVVRNAGHVVETGAIGSIEFGVDLLHTAVVVVLGHQNCGAVGAAREALATGLLPNNFVRVIVNEVMPDLVTGTAKEAGDDHSPLDLHLAPRADLVAAHVRGTVHTLHTYSATLAEAVTAGRCAIVGMEYSLEDGSTRVVEVIGDIGAGV